MIKSRCGQIITFHLHGTNLQMYKLSLCLKNSHNIKEFVLQQNKICRIDAVPFCNIFQDADCYGSIQPHPRHVIFQLNAKTVALP